MAVDPSTASRQPAALAETHYSHLQLTLRLCFDSCLETNPTDAYSLVLKYHRRSGSIHGFVGESEGKSKRRIQILSDLFLKIQNSTRRSWW
jgi:hypothetical protein